MLGRFVCPASLLSVIPPLLEDSPGVAPPMPLSVVCRGGATKGELVWNLGEEVQQILTFQDGHADKVTVASLELRLTEEVIGPSEGGAFAQLVEALPSTFWSRDLAGLTLYFEIPPGPAWRAVTAAVVSGLAARRGSNWSEDIPPAGVKVRCASQDNALSPTPEQVANVLTACRDAGVSLKFTAGLHHPFRNRDPLAGTYRHGFLNVFGAAVLAQAQGLSEGLVTRILEEEETGAFHFDEQGLRWKEYRATTDEIVKARSSFVHSFGSCSFDEPREDLRALGLFR
jgi:hypothetical protein